MRKTLIVVDIQNDFIDGTLGTKEARAIVPNVAKRNVITILNQMYQDMLLNQRLSRLIRFIKKCIVMM